MDILKTIEVRNELSKINQTYPQLYEYNADMNLDSIDEQAIIVNVTYTNGMADNQPHFRFATINLYVYNINDDDFFTQLGYERPYEVETDDHLNANYTFTKTVLVLSHG